MFDDAAPCARCGRAQPADGLRLWAERRRLRRFSDGAFRNLHQDHYHAVCATCFAALSRGGAVQDVQARRGVLALLAVMALAAAMAALTPAAIPGLKSAFWRNCLRNDDCPSAPRYW
jgi:hypothetical protein